MASVEDKKFVDYRIVKTTLLPLLLSSRLVYM